MRQRPMNRRINHEPLTLVGHSGGVTLTAKIALCSWNSGEGVSLIIEFADGSGGNTHVRDPQLAVEDATDADYQRMIDSVRVVPCTTCGGPAFDPATTVDNREGQCEACFLKALNAEFDAAMAKEAQKLATLDAKYKAQGFTHRIEGWIHPHQGEDRQISLWLQNPTTKMIQTELKRAGSAVLDDYQLIEL